MLARNDLAEYIAENYGECRISPCKCLREGWLGTRCKNWVPIQASSWEELRLKMGPKLGEREIG